MKIDVGLDGQLDLVALFGKDQYALIMGQLPNEDEDEEGEDKTTNEQIN